MAGFGIGTDHFGLDSASFTLIESTSVPASVSMERAQDESGYIVGEGSYAGGPATELSCTYKLISSTLDLATIALGGADPAITKVEVSTSNGDWPTVKITGYDGVTASDSWTLPSITLTGAKTAQGLDFSVGANCRLTSSSFVATAEIHHAIDDAGIVGATAVTGAELEISGEAVEIDGAVSWTPGGTWTETQGPGAGTGNISWATASFAASKMLAVDAE